MAKRTRLKHVLLLVESTRAYARGLILGIARFNHDDKNWQLEYHPYDMMSGIPDGLASWHGDGIIARINSRDLLENLASRNVPVIDVRRLFPHSRIPQLGPDNQAIARLLFDHFRERGYYSFAFFGYAGNRKTPLKSRGEYFHQQVVEAGFSCSSFVAGREERGRFTSSERARLRKWLTTLPDQTALAACNDDCAMVVLQECRTLGISIPDTIAVAGIGNDDCLCNVSLPHLTSVDVDAQNCGYAAAAMLDAMMTTGLVPPPKTFIPPKGVIARASTDSVAGADSQLKAALLFIRENATTGITPRDVLREVNLSRVALENRFKSILKRTIHDEIIRVRLRHVCELLTTTELPIKAIANFSGFNYPEYLIRLFQKEFGESPTEYRKHQRTIHS